MVGGGCPHSSRLGGQGSVVSSPSGFWCIWSLKEHFMADDKFAPTLLMRQRVDFKICLLVYKCLHQLAAPYLVSMISPVSAVSSLYTSPLALGRSR